MRTNIDIDEQLIREAMKLTGSATKREAVDSALRLMVRMKRQEKMRELRGKLHWDGDLKAMRRDRFER